MRFYFHFFDADKIHLDEDGMELPDWETAYAEAYEAAKELWGLMLEERRDPTRCAFQVADAAGQEAFRFPFSEVLSRPAEPPVSQRIKRLREARERGTRLSQAIQAQVDTANARLQELRHLCGELDAAIAHRP